MQWKLFSKNRFVFGLPLTEIVDEEIPNASPPTSTSVSLSTSTISFALDAAVSFDTIEMFIRDGLRLPCTVPKTLLLIRRHLWSALQTVAKCPFHRYTRRPLPQHSSGWSILTAACPFRPPIAVRTSMKA
uniref:Uncharacterized protein n=1 Tax=Panagrellus redivivus TaxID=6233 RepID=A0A7E5A082_PANRE